MQAGRELRQLRCLPRRRWNVVVRRSLTCVLSEGGNYQHPDNKSDGCRERQRAAKYFAELLFAVHGLGLLATQRERKLTWSGFTLGGKGDGGARLQACMADRHFLTRALAPEVRFYYLSG